MKFRGRPKETNEFFLRSRRLPTYGGLNVVPALTASAPAAAADNAQRFHGFRVLGWMALNDPRQHGEVLDILGQEQNFVPQHSACMFAEFGVSIAQPNGQPAAPPPWPYPESGLPPETAKRVVAVVQRTFGGG
jgi:hypothetical protein